jgi:hypothetical protein
VGNGTDYGAAMKGMLAVVGSFSAVKNLTSEEDEGTENSFSLQLNTNTFSNDATSACNKAPGCTAWEQFLFDTYPNSKDHGFVFVQYWLINYISAKGPSGCPSSDWIRYGTSPDCYKNSKAAAPPLQKITNLPNLELEGTVSNGDPSDSCDTAILWVDGEGYSSPCSSSIFDLVSHWNRAEFNVLGVDGGTEAVFNGGVALTVNITVASALASATMSCLPSGSGTTGETNTSTWSRAPVWGLLPGLGRGSSTLLSGRATDCPNYNEANRT